MPQAQTERRLFPRLEFRVPLRLRVLEANKSETFQAESVNLCERGVCFNTDRPFRVGTPLEVTLTMPREITGHNATDVKCTARVVHVQPGRNAAVKPTIGAYFEQVEPITGGSYWGH